MKIKLIACVTIALTQPLIGTAIADSNMNEALENLQKARENLQQATPDKGGHRVNAIKLVNQAISEIRAGVEYDRSHISQSEKGNRPPEKILRDKVEHR